MIAKGPPERFAIIVISRYQKVRYLEPPKHRPQSSILVRRTSFGEVPGRENDIGSGLQMVQAGDRAAKVIGGIGHVVQHVPAASNVQIRNLRNDHVPSITCASYPRIKGTSMRLERPVRLPKTARCHYALRPSDTP